MKEILVFTAGRSDFGILKNIISKIKSHKSFNLTLIIGPAHNSKIFGFTNQEIETLKIEKKIFLKSRTNNSSGHDILNSMSQITRDIANNFSKKKYDAAIVLGDRYEALNFVICCFILRIPIIHIGGGSITLGSLDDIYRKCISQMASLHFVETSNHKKNLNNIGIKKNIFITGAPALENIYDKKTPLSILNGKYDDFIKSKKKRIIACFHPETNISKNKNIKNLKKLISFLNSIKQKIIFTYPNADEGYLDYIKLIEKNLDKKNSMIVKNFGIQKYHLMLSNSDLLIGNSSSGIIESCSFKIPCINLGDRQKQRLSPKNIIHSTFDIKNILKAYNKATSNRFKLHVINLKNPYENKNTSNKILNIINNKIKLNFR
jgi:UDP-hydrolysing UDP-N-acetyl-D-glucosamine 2-epimerase